MFLSKFIKEVCCFLIKVAQVLLLLLSLSDKMLCSYQRSIDRETGTLTERSNSDTTKLDSRRQTLQANCAPSIYTPEQGSQKCAQEGEADTVSEPFIEPAADTETDAGPLICVDADVSLGTVLELVTAKQRSRCMLPLSVNCEAGEPMPGVCSGASTCQLLSWRPAKA